MSDSESVEEGKCPGCGEKLAPGYNLCQDCEKDQENLGLVDEEEEEPKYYSQEEITDDDDSESESDSDSDSDSESDEEDVNLQEDEVKIVRSGFNLSFKIQPMVILGTDNKSPNKSQPSRTIVVKK